MGGFPILSALTFLPLVGALIIMAVRAATAGSSSSETANEGRTALLAGLVISGATFLVSLAAFFYYDPSTPGYQLVEQHVWYASISYKLGIDGLSLPLILLTYNVIALKTLSVYVHGSIRGRLLRKHSSEGCVRGKLL